MVKDAIQKFGRDIPLKTVTVGFNDNRRN